MYSMPASRKPYKPAAHVFHSVEIEGFIFSGVMNGGDPLLVSGGWVQLGMQAILCETPTGMQVCKYRAGEERINVSVLSPEGIERLRHEFGLGPTSAMYNPFIGCPAYASLVEWARRHPRKAARAVLNYHLGQWREEAGIKVRRDEQAVT